MVEFINAMTGSLMLVADERKEEYLKAGHKLKDAPKEKPAEEKPKKTTKTKK